jgi:hypothetical protein
VFGIKRECGKTTILKFGVVSSKWTFMQNNLARATVHQLKQRENESSTKHSGSHGCSGIDGIA